MREGGGGAQRFPSKRQPSVSTSRPHKGRTTSGLGSGSLPMLQEMDAATSPRIPVHVEVRRQHPAPRNAPPTSDCELSDRVNQLIATLPMVEDGPLDCSSTPVRATGAFAGALLVLRHRGRCRPDGQCIPPPRPADHPSRVPDRDLQNVFDYVEAVRVAGLAERMDFAKGDAEQGGGGGSHGLDSFAGARGAEPRHGWGGGRSSASLPFWKVLPIVHVYTCREDVGRQGGGLGGAAAALGAEGAPAGGRGEPDDFFGHADGCEKAEADEAAQDLYSIVDLPARSLEGVWESLILDADVKLCLLEYIASGCLFSRRHVDSKLVSWNRVALLHGPPGSGKTSLSRALAHKLAIRLDCRDAKLLEIYANSLFSKWFSESARNVGKMFAKIRGAAESCDLLVVLIDEVESLSASRAAGSAGAEPADTLRVVNALLTAIDSLRALPNVLVMATSNLADQIDAAFLDRADIKQFIGLPSLGARYEILRGGVNELIKCGILRSPDRADAAAGEDGGGRGGGESRVLQSFRNISLSDPGMFAGGYGRCGTDLAAQDEGLLHAAAHAADGLSGRVLRKLCLLAHARLLRAGSPESVPLASFLDALRRAAAREVNSLQARR
jgi:pachytene checkpoint protein 2